MVHIRVLGISLSLDLNVEESFFGNVRTSLVQTRDKDASYERNDETTEYSDICHQDRHHLASLKSLIL